MSDPSGRMLRLLSLLQTHRFWSGHDLAERLAVTERTLRRDIDRLRELGYPVGASRGVGGGYQLEAGGALAPLLLDDDEAIAIAVGLRTAAAGAVAGAEETSVRALTKLVRMMPPKLRRRADALASATVPTIFAGGPTVDAEALATLAGACQDGERVRFEYTPRDGAAATRLVEPYRLVTVGRRWYLVAWDVDRADWRTFRVDRLSDPRSTRYRVTPREIPGGDAAAFVRSQMASVPTRYEVVVRLATDPATVERALGGWGSVEPDGDAACRLRMNTDTLDWPVMVLAALGAPFEVISPPELRTHVAAVAEQFGAAAADTGAREAG